MLRYSRSLPDLKETPFDLERCLIDSMARKLSNDIEKYRVDVLEHYLDRVTDEPLFVSEGRVNPKIEAIYKPNSIVEYWFCRNADEKVRIVSIQEEINMQPQCTTNQGFSMYGEIIYKIL